ncbi:MAG: hypothetical protein HFJ51_05210 [Clostridia bacterium]|nr:hypothetical protein [Clostridia bacterium]
MGNEASGINGVEFIIKIDETKSIIQNLTEEFNLIYLNQTLEKYLSYSSVNEEIASVNEKGIITGKNIGTTRIQATSSLDQKVYSILVRVIEKDSEVAPKIVAGENFASVVREDAIAWSFGYNGDGRLGVNSYLAKDIPTKTGINLNFKDIKAGKSFLIALNNDGTVWGVRK